MASLKSPAVDMKAVRVGDHAAFTVAVAACAAHWFVMAGSHIAFPAGPSDVAKEGDSAKAGLLAAAMELRDLLTQAPDGRQALRDFGFEPLLQDVEGE